MAQQNNYQELLDHRTSKDEVQDYFEPVSTGSLMFDIFLDGGYRAGISRFYAPAEHGKTAQALTWAREWMKKYKEKAIIYYFDAEGRLTYDKVEQAGLAELDNFVWEGSQGDTFNHFVYNRYEPIATFIYEKILETQKNKTGEKYFFVIDSLDMLMTNDGYKKGFEDAEKVGAAQVISSLVMKKIGIFMAKYGHHFHILSQIRANINIANPNSPKTKVSGGNAMLHGSSLTGAIQQDWSETYIYENPQGKTKDAKGKIIGKYHTIKFTKTFNDKTHHVIRIPVKYGHGIWWEREVADLMIAYGLVLVKGAWFSLADESWPDQINKYVSDKLRKEYIYEKAQEEKQKAKEEGRKITPKDQKALLAKFEEEAKESISFEMETKWQGYDNFFSYLEENQMITEWIDSQLRETLLDFSGERVSEDEEVAYDAYEM